jgi:glycosyltransferase involved in cell wall biosynthesis
MPDISVVIPTRNRAALLGRCLANLCEQTLDPARYEICVVINASRDKTDKAIELVSAHYANHKIITIDEPTLGTARARNAGVRHTTSPLIAQGDDDVTVPSDWLEKFIAAFAQQDIRVGKIAGDIRPVWGALRPDWLQDDMLAMLGACSGLGDQACFSDKALPVGNACYRREALDSAGLFPEKLGRKGNNLLSGENAVDLVMHKQGWKLYYDPSITIDHAITADRLQPSWIRRRAFWQGVSDFAERVYLQAKQVEIGGEPATNLPLDRDYWKFINDSAEVPGEGAQAKLRSLGFVLARSGFIPT